MKTIRKSDVIGIKYNRCVIGRDRKTKERHYLFRAFGEWNQLHNKFHRYANQYTITALSLIIDFIFVPIAYALNPFFRYVDGAISFIFDNFDATNQRYFVFCTVVYSSLISAIIIYLVIWGKC